jgi:hypothetical protein
VSREIMVQFVGFESKPRVREFKFTVRELSVEPREFTLTIANEAFDTRRVRYQDAPDVCSLKLRQELAANANHPPNTHYRITDADLEIYRSTHAGRTPKSPYFRKPVESF